MSIDSKDVELRIRARFEGQKTLSELTDQLKELEKVQQKQATDAGKGVANAKELDTTYQRLERSLRAVAAAFNETRQYEKQNEGLATLKQRLEAAKVKQDAFAASLAKGAELTEKQSLQQYRLGVAVDRASTSFDRARARLEASAGRLRQYGIDTGKIADAQSNMSAMILRGNVALKAQEEAIDKAVSSQKRMAGNDVSTALERIKMQLIGMAAAYVGVQQAAGLAGGTVKAYSSREGVKNQLALSVGNDRTVVDAEYEYVKGQSDRIGLEYDRAAKGYAKFAAAASMAGRSREEIRYIWEAFAEVGRVANLSTEDLDGVFKALEQITSKGKIQAEELRGQLGDRLFGAFQVAAKALKDIREIALMIAKVTILKAIQNSGTGSTIGDFISSLIKHEGGLVAAGAGPTRQVSPFMFTGAPRYHTGGIAGLAPNEYPAILQKNEEVLRADDPRNILNGRPAPAQQSSPTNLKIINMVDSGSVVSEGLSSQQGEKAIFNFIRANRTGLKQILG